jgi:NAD-dependent dihydropyrimidine dehydrogenase PreA subunit
VQWKHKVKIRHLFTEEETSEAVNQSMTAVGNVLRADTWFKNFEHLDRFFEVDDLDEANDLLGLMYDYCDRNAIWVELEE